jgi:CubicO group peptidase (beta-lactamase class C family)
MKKANLLYFKQYFIHSVISMILLTGCSQTHVRDTNYSYSAPKQLGDGIKTDNIKNASIDSNRINELTQLILKDTFANIHSLLITRDNKLVYENYFSGKDEYWGLSLGYAKHGTNILHDIRSISKSVVSACIDIAIQQQRIESIDDPIFNYLPDYIKFKTPQNEKISIRHLLTMSSGIKWNENLPIGAHGNNETQMERSLNPVEYVLSQPMDTIPGAVWNYNSGGVQVLAEIIKSVSGDDIDKFAGKYLFKPLGIKNYKWVKSSKSAILFHPGKIFSHRRSFLAAASGLRLTSRDLLKFGLLYLNNGRWDEKQILTENWINETFKTQILRDNKSTIYGYSYLFWTYTETIDNETFLIVSARGLGGQRIFMNKELNFIVVITAGNYRRNDIQNDGQLALDKYILPALYGQ